MAFAKIVVAPAETPAEPPRMRRRMSVPGLVAAVVLLNPAGSAYAVGGQAADGGLDHALDPASTAACPGGAATPPARVQVAMPAGRELPNTGPQSATPLVAAAALLIAGLLLCATARRRMRGAAKP